MTPEQLKRIHAFWAEAYGFDATALDHPGFSLVTLEGLASPPRLVVLRTDRAAVVFVPPFLASRLRASLAPFEGQVVTASDVQAALGDVPTTPGNADFILYHDDTRSPAQDDPRIRRLQQEDASSLDDLNAAVSDLERDLGNVSMEHDVVLGYFEAGRLLGAASLIIEDDVADVGVLTHPEARGRSVGRALVGALAAEGTRHGWLVQYTTMERNVGSVKIAQATGFVPFAVEEALRVTESQ
ncbi:GNAT family N-acetyltransferase [Deinococcus ruber]|uniref:N-acetyltransferase domain-containing protein n=1 Tax=Deinococcus ruber TaxID=1848197 RepID=A0A918FJB9_9DEIO|nr:GNAT family N-acetyltransferase [Deinococcus ruber]GGR41854.1 hypothetical protein GCM10008957_56940 [Deinococcus ruber]